MDGILPFYQVDATTWCYLSFLLTVTVFFRFSRIWSLRNLDLALLLSISPGLLFVRAGDSAGYVWLFVASGLLLVRLFSDSYFTRRPLVEHNLNSYGLTFLCFVVFTFLMMKVVNEKVDVKTTQTFNQAKVLPDKTTQQKKISSGLTSSIFAATASKFSNAISKGKQPTQILTIISHLAVVLGLVWIGRYHFNDTHSGIAMATLYLLIPATAYDITKVNHVIPAVLILWAFVAFRKPVISGGLMGLACGTLFFPIFLLPLWLAFYGRKGALKFGLSLVVVVAILAGSLLLTSIDAQAFREQLGGAIDWSVVSFKADVDNGFWMTHEAAYRIPVFVSFLLMLVVLTIFPRKKNLEHLIAHSTAIVVGTQFWYPQAGGIYLLWYLPLFLLVMFRPRLSQLVPIANIDLSINVKNTSPSNRKQSEPTVTRSHSNSLFQ